MVRYLCAPGWENGDPVLARHAAGGQELLLGDDEDDGGELEPVLPLERIRGSVFFCSFALPCLLFFFSHHMIDFLPGHKGKKAQTGSNEGGWYTFCPYISIVR